jgi:hypothetical protein
VDLGVELEFETVLFTFNPKHESFYRKLLNAETVAYQERMDNAHIEAGAVLMRVEMKNCNDRWLTKEQKEKIMAPLKTHLSSLDG